MKHTFQYQETSERNRPRGIIFWYDGLLNEFLSKDVTILLPHFNTLCANPTQYSVYFQTFTGSLLDQDTWVTRCKMANSKICSNHHDRLLIEGLYKDPCPWISFHISIHFITCQLLQRRNKMDLGEIEACLAYRKNIQKRWSANGVWFDKGLLYNKIVYCVNLIATLILIVRGNRYSISVKSCSCLSRLSKNR